MVSFLELVNAGFKLEEFKNPLEDAYRKVRTQAERHTRRDAQEELMNIVRPNEPDGVKAYRQSIARHITQEGVYKFLSKLARIFKNSGLLATNSVLSDKLAEYLDDIPFKDSAKAVGIDEYMLRVIALHATEDVNAIAVAFPYSKANPHISPSLPVSEGGHPPEEVIDIKPVVIGSDRIVIPPHHDIVAWIAGQMDIGTDREDFHPFYYVGDSQAWWRYKPTGYDNDSNVIYEAELWYLHGSGVVPAVSMPGVSALYTPEDPSAELTDSPIVPGAMQYNESYLRPYFEYADEFMVSFSDSQAVRVQHAFPKVVISETPCAAEGCNDGKVASTGKDGAVHMVDCKACGGSGIIKGVSPYAEIIRPQTRGSDKPGPILEYITPPSDSLEYTHKVAFEFLKMGKQAIGLDLLENINESGVAKEHRLEDLLDMLNNIGNGYIEMMEAYLWLLECLLVVDPDSRTEPQVNRPKNYSIKAPQELLEEAVGGLISDRPSRATKYYSVAYRGDVNKIKVLRLSHVFAPLISMSESEIALRLNTGTYTTRDLFKADVAVSILTEVAQAQPEVFNDLDDEVVLARAEEIFNTRYNEIVLPIVEPGQSSPEPELDEDGNPIEPEPGQELMHKGWYHSTQG